MTAVPAATVVLVRDGRSGLETLLLRRNSALGFAAGAWVFPGGRVDPSEIDDSVDDLVAARRAAVRETREEAGLVIEPASLVPFSHWTPPPDRPRRFVTWVFLAPASDAAVTVDGGEITEHLWLSPADALAAHGHHEIELLPPTWVSLAMLSTSPDVASAIRDAAARPVERFATRVAVIDGGAIALFHGDAGYDDVVPDRPGSRHRLWMVDRPWRYERD